jgi:hypothetical protein
MREVRRMIRKIGKDKIIDRISAYKNNEYMPNDILSSILSSYSKRDFLIRPTAKS